MIKPHPIPRQFFRQQVVQLARALLGKILVSVTKHGIIKARIVETQAYKAPLDKACHAFGNKKTQRTKYFWLDGGHFYIYVIYGNKNVCLNITAGKQGQPEAVLIRAVEPIQGLAIVQKLRQIKSKKSFDLTNGPGKVGMALGINKDEMNGHDLTKGQRCWLEEEKGFKFEVQVTKRINIDYAQQWIQKPWRFTVKGNGYVSKQPKQKSRPLKQTKQQRAKSKTK